MCLENQKPKRGWVFDQLMIVGQLEAAMNHNDEELCNIMEEMESHPDDQELLDRKVEELAANEEIIKLDYQNRVDTLNQIFDAIPNSNRHYYCQIKHHAAAYVQAAENYHARGCSPEAEETLVRCGKTLALTCSLAFGFEPFSCLRCLDEAMKAQLDGGEGPLEGGSAYKIAPLTVDEAAKKLAELEKSKKEPAL